MKIEQSNTETAVHRDKKIRVVRMLSSMDPLRGIVSQLYPNGRVPAGRGVTLVDTGRQLLGNPESPDLLTEKSLKNRLQRAVPSLHTKITAPVTGIDLYGNPNRPMVGLTLEDPLLDDENPAILGKLDAMSMGYASPFDQYKPHVSLIRAGSADEGLEIQAAIESNLPHTVVLQGASIWLMDRQNLAARYNHAEQAA